MAEQREFCAKTASAADSFKNGLVGRSVLYSMFSRSSGAGGGCSSPGRRTVSCNRKAYYSQLVIKL